MLNQRIRQLVDYGIRTGLISEYERIYTTNLLLEIFQEPEYTEPENPGEEDLPEILAGLLDEAAKRGILKDQSVTGRDLFDTKLMNCLVPRPSQVIAEFQRRYQKSPRAATEYFYRLSQDSDYIRRYRVKKDMGGGKPLRPSGYLHQPVQAGKGSQGDRSGQDGEAGRISQMPALPGVRGLRRAAGFPRQRESPDRPGCNRRSGVVVPVFPLCLLQ